MEKILDFIAERIFPLSILVIVLALICGIIYEETGVRGQKKQEFHEKCALTCAPHPIQLTNWKDGLCECNAARTVHHIKEEGK